MNKENISNEHQSRNEEFQNYLSCVRINTSSQPTNDLQIKHLLYQKLASIGQQNTDLFMKHLLKDINSRFILEYSMSSNLESLNEKISREDRQLIGKAIKKIYQSYKNAKNFQIKYFDSQLNQQINQKIKIKKKHLSYLWPLLSSNLECISGILLFSYFRNQLDSFNIQNQLNHQIIQENERENRNHLIYQMLEEQTLLDKNFLNGLKQLFPKQKTFRLQGVISIIEGGQLCKKTILNHLQNFLIQEQLKNKQNSFNIIEESKDNRQNNQSQDINSLQMEVQVKYQQFFPQKSHKQLYNVTEPDKFFPDILQVISYEEYQNLSKNLSVILPKIQHTQIDKEIQKKNNIKMDIQSDSNFDNIQQTITIKRRAGRCLSADKQTNIQKTQASPRIKRPRNKQTEKKIRKNLFMQTQRKFQYFIQFRKKQNKVKQRNQIRRNKLAKKGQQKRNRKNAQKIKRRNAAQQFFKKSKARFEDNYLYYGDRLSSESQDEQKQFMDIQPVTVNAIQQKKKRKQKNNAKQRKILNRYRNNLQSQPQQGFQAENEYQHYQESQQIRPHQRLLKRKMNMQSQDQDLNAQVQNSKKKKIVQQKFDSQSDIQNLDPNQEQLRVLPFTKVSNQSFDNIQVDYIDFWTMSKENLYDNLRSCFTSQNFFRTFSRKHLIGCYKSSTSQILREEIINSYKNYEQNNALCLIKKTNKKSWVKTAIIFSKLHSLTHVLANKPNQMIKNCFLLPALKNIVSNAVIEFLGSIANMLISDSNKNTLQEAINTLEIITIINTCSLQPCPFNTRDLLQLIYSVLQNLLKSFSNNQQQQNDLDISYITIIKPKKRFNEMFRISIKQQNLLLLGLITIVYAERVYLPTLFPQQQMKNLIKNKTSKSVWKLAKQAIRCNTDKINPDKLENLFAKIMTIQEIYNQDYCKDSFDLWFDISQIAFEQKIYHHSINLIEKYVILCLKQRKSKKQILNKITKQSFLSKCELINNPNQTYIIGYGQVLTKLVSIKYEDRLSLAQQPLVISQLLKFAEVILNKKVDTDFLQKFQNLLLVGYNSLIQVDLILKGNTINDKFYQNCIESKKMPQISNNNIERFRQTIQRYLLSEIIECIEYVYKQHHLMPDNVVLNLQTAKMTTLGINFLTSMFGNCTQSLDSHSKPYKTLQNFGYLFSLLFKLAKNLMIIKNKLGQTFCKTFIYYFEAVSKLSSLLFYEEQKKLLQKIKLKKQKGQDYQSDNDEFDQLVIFKRNKCGQKITQYLIHRNIQNISKHIPFKIKIQQQITRNHESYAHLMGILDCTQTIFGKNLKQYSFKTLENIFINFRTIQISKQAGSNYYSIFHYYISYIFGIFKAMSLCFPKQSIDFSQKIIQNIKKLIFLGLIVGGQEKAKTIEILKLIRKNGKFRKFVGIDKLVEDEQISICWLLNTGKNHSELELLNDLKLIIELIDCGVVGQYEKQFQKLDRYDRVSQLSKQIILLYCYFSSLQKQFQEQKINLSAVKELRGAIIRLRKMIQSNNLTQQTSQKAMLTLLNENNLNISRALIFCVSENNLSTIIEYLSLKSDQLGLPLDDQNWVFNAYCKIIATEQILANNIKKSNKIKKLFKIAEELLSTNNVYSNLVRLIIKKICKNWFEILDYFIKYSNIQRKNTYENACKTNISILIDLLKNTVHFQGYLLIQFESRLSFIEQHYLPLYGNSYTIQTILIEILASPKPDIMHLYSLVKKRVSNYELCNYGMKNCPQYHQLKKIIQRCIKSLEGIEQSTENTILRQKYEILLSQLNKDPSFTQQRMI